MSRMKIGNSLSKNINIYLLGGILLLGGVARLWHIGSFNFWLDEIVSIHMAGNFHNILGLSYEPFFYYKVLSVWTGLFGNGEIAIRSLSTFFDLGSIYMLYLCGKMLINRNSALVAAFIYSIAPFTVWYAREARNYSLSVFLMLIVFFFFIQALRSGKNIHWFLFCISLILSFYTSYIAFVIIPTCLTVVLILPGFRKYWKRTILVLIISLGVFIPYSMFFLRSLSEVSQNFWIPKPTLKSLLFTLENFNLGYTVDVWGYAMSHLFFTLPFIIGTIHLLRSKHLHFYTLMTFLCLPILIIYTISRWIPVYLDRKLIICTPFYYLMLAYGLTIIKPRLLKFAFMASGIVLMLVSLVGLYNGFMNANFMHHLGVHPKKPITKVVDYVNSKFLEGDVIAHTNYSTTLPFHWYGVKIEGPLRDCFLKGMRPYFFYSRADIDNFWLSGFMSNKAPEELVDVSNIDNLDQFSLNGIWLFQTDWAHSGDLDSNSEAVKDKLSFRYKLIDEKLLNGILVSYYKGDIR